MIIFSRSFSRSHDVPRAYFSVVFPLFVVLEIQNVVLEIENCGKGFFILAISMNRSTSSLVQINLVQQGKCKSQPELVKDPGI